ncbi:MAG: SH3 domain-containing protein [Thermoguttaceae bacterium]|nr:SH3 domain-containing protein [Thermoguttaceae bacterium]
MRLPVLFLFIVCLCTSVQAQTFPYRATVCEPEAFVRSGPGRDFYPTDKLRNGDTVEVYKHTVDGWCAIRPPLGSFSYVPARNVQMTQNDLGMIVGNSVPVYIGSRLSPDRSQMRISLTAGKIVEVLELPTEGLDAMVKISPPSGEFRWIHGKSLSPNLTGVTEEPAPPDRTLPGTIPVSDSPVLSSEDLPGGANSMEEASVKPGTFAYFVNQLDADLSYIISNGDSAQWKTEGLLMRANRLMNYAKTTQEKERLEHVRQKIIEADNVRQNRQQFQKILSTASEDGITPLSAGSDQASRPNVNYSGVSEFPAPFSTEPGRWDYSGILVKVQRQRYAHLSLPPYAIVNEDGILRCYVTPAPNMDLSPYVKKRVSLAGSRNYMRDQRAFNLNAKIIVNAW